MKVDVPIDPNDIREKQADERGRVTLGSEFANKRVLVTVLESEDPIDYEAAEESAAELIELFDESDFERVYSLLQEGRMEDAYDEMGMTTEEAESKAAAWRDSIFGEEE
jgi:hypothetical protein